MRVFVASVPASGRGVRIRLSGSAVVAVDLKAIEVSESTQRQRFAGEILASDIAAYRQE